MSTPNAIAAVWTQGSRLGLVSRLGTLGAHVRQGVWFIFVATDLAVVVTALVFTIADRRPRDDTR